MKKLLMLPAALMLVAMAGWLTPASARTTSISWQGYDWVARTVAGNPGAPQQWSANNVSIDNAGRLHLQPLALLELLDEFAAGFVVRHAAVVEADHIRRRHRLALIDNRARAWLDRHAERQRDAQNLAGVAIRLDQHGCDHRLPSLAP